MIKEKLFKTILKNIIRPRLNVSIVTNMITMLVNAKSTTRYKLQKNFHIFLYIFIFIFMTGSYPS
jgi:hypothetical protein